MYMCLTSYDTTIASSVPSSGNCFTSPWTTVSGMCYSIGAGKIKSFKAILETINYKF